MTKDKDLGSDAARTDASRAEQDREKLGKQAEEKISHWMQEEMQGDAHPEQDPAEGSRETVERNLREQDDEGSLASRGSSPGDQAVEPSLE